MPREASHRVEYDRIADAFDNRYRRLDFGETEAFVRRFVGDGATAVAEVGCGTGHWLAALQGRARLIAGVDPSAGMLQHAKRSAPFARLARARGEALPWGAQSFDRLLCVHVLHHLSDPAAFLAEACRVLRPGGTILIVGIDPHAGVDRWWLYDFFPAALETDLARYHSTPWIRTQLSETGFEEVATTVAQHVTATIPYETAREQGLLDRGATSQLMLMRDADYEAGLRRIDGTRADLFTDLRVYATTGRVPPPTAPV